MSTSDVHVGDVGTVFLVTILDSGVAVNLSGGYSGSQVIAFRKPGGEIVNKTASFYTNGSDGKIKYTTIAGDIDQAGVWNISAIVIIPEGKWTATSTPFTVKSTFG